MIIIDNFLDGSLLEEIRQDNLWEDNLPYTWSNYGSSPTNVYTKVANYIWYEKFVYDKEFDGYEYWTQVIDNRGIDWHYDKDEHLFWEQKVLSCPKLGSIYYAHSEPVSGGFLEIERDSGIERIEPVPNRLIIFNSAKRHRVEKSSGNIRRSLLTNIWTKKPSEENF